MHTSRALVSVLCLGSGCCVLHNLIRFLIDVACQWMWLECVSEARVAACVGTLCTCRSIVQVSIMHTFCSSSTVNFEICTSAVTDL